jgi:multisubunit Na+/H+ antiporter MnhG subunit
VSRLAVDVFLALAVATSWLGAAAFLFLAAPYDRLHVAAYVTLAAGFFVTLAVIASHPASALVLKAVIIYAALIVTGAIINHAIGRALRLRDESGDRP